MRLYSWKDALSRSRWTICGVRESVCLPSNFVCQSVPTPSRLAGDGGSRYNTNTHLHLRPHSRRTWIFWRGLLLILSLPCLLLSYTTTEPTKNQRDAIETQVDRSGPGRREPRGEEAQGEGECRYVTKFTLSLPTTQSIHWKRNSLWRCLQPRWWGLRLLDCLLVKEPRRATRLETPTSKSTSRHLQHFNSLAQTPICILFLSYLLFSSAHTHIFSKSHPSTTNLQLTRLRDASSSECGATEGAGQ